MPDFHKATVSNNGTQRGGFADGTEDYGTLHYIINSPDRRKLRLKERIK